MNFLEEETCSRAMNLLGSLQVKRDEAPDGSDGFLGMPKRDSKKYSILKAIAWKLASIGHRLHGWGGIDQYKGVEAEAHNALVKKLGEPSHQGAILIPADVLDVTTRDATVASAGSGGFLVGASISSFVEMLKNKSVTASLGVARVSNQRDHVLWAKQTAGPSVTWQANESTPAAESTPSFVQLSASPKTAIAYHEVSRQALNQFSPAGEQLFRSALADGVALAGDLAVLNGSGVSGQPTGLFNVSGIGAVTGTSMDYAKLVEFQTDVADANAVLNPGTLAYVTTPSVAALLKSRQRFTGSDTPLWRGQIAKGEIEGALALSSRQMPASAMLFGDWSTVFVVEWNVLEIQVNPFADFKSGVVGIRALWPMDVIVTHPSAFSLATAIT
ncbi:MAG: phage major capsid protein [Nitrospira sp.]|nr:phage major capsid protein [Nitrospira sp.]